MSKKTKNQQKETQPLANFHLPKQEMQVEMKEISLSKFKRMLANSMIIVPKDFQREEVYTDAQKQSLIESALLQKPIPALLLYQEDKNKEFYLMADGQQRLTAFRDLFSGKLLFNSYDDRVKELNGYSYPDLPEEIREEINDLKLHVQIIHGIQLNEVQRYYTLLNSSSQPLSPGELFYAVPNPAHKFFLECCNMTIINKVGNYKRKPKWTLIARLFFQFEDGDLSHNLYVGKPVTTMLRFFNSVDEHTMTDLWNKVRHLLNTVANCVGDCTMPRGADQMFNWIAAIGYFNEHHKINPEEMQQFLNWILDYMHTQTPLNPRIQEEINLMNALHNTYGPDKITLFVTTFEKLYCEAVDLWQN